MSRFIDQQELLFFQLDCILAHRCTNSYISRRCGSNSDCADTKSGPKCVCHKGFVWSDRTQSCKDVNECSIPGMLSPCKGNSKCHNTEGSFYCECPPGLKGDYCHLDIDECAEGTQVKFEKKNRKIKILQTKMSILKPGPRPNRPEGPND